jgi:hypothetical protein
VLYPVPYPCNYSFFMKLKMSSIPYLILISVLITKENLLGILVHSRLLKVLQHISGLPGLFFSLSQNYIHNHKLTYNEYLSDDFCQCCGPGSESPWIRIDLALIDPYPDPHSQCGSESRSQETDHN